MHHFTSRPGLAWPVRFLGVTVCANSRSSWPSVLHILNGKYCTWTGRLEVGCWCINLQPRPPQRHSSGSDQTLVLVKSSICGWGLPLVFLINTVVYIEQATLADPSPASCIKVLHVSSLLLSTRGEGNTGSCNKSLLTWDPLSIHQIKGVCKAESSARTQPKHGERKAHDQRSRCIFLQRNFIEKLSILIQRKKNLLQISSPANFSSPKTQKCFSAGGLYFLRSYETYGGNPPVKSLFILHVFSKHIYSWALWKENVSRWMWRWWSRSILAKGGAAGICGGG